MSNSHNKKRNTGLLYEFLVRAISSSLVEGNQKMSSLALKILKKHFKIGSVLYKEFRLINSLLKTTVSSEAVAASIMNEAKTAARGHNQKELNKLKSSLIHEINRSIGDDNFFDAQINEYRMYATIQTLLNDWRSPHYDLGRLAQYEDQLIKWLTTEKVVAQDQIINEESPGSGRLLMKIMMNKLNEKYSGVLTNEQRSLIKAYAFSTANDDASIIKNKMQETKQELVNLVNTYLNTNNNTYLQKKLLETRDQLLGESLDIIDDETVTRFMLYTKLIAELKSEEVDNV